MFSESTVLMVLLDTSVCVVWLVESYVVSNPRVAVRLEAESCAGNRSRARSTAHLPGVLAAR